MSLCQEIGQGKCTEICGMEASLYQQEENYRSPSCIENSQEQEEVRDERSPLS